ncbi:MAG: nucleotidyltransferase, partial [Proteobacteria bacterium]|nr:nucleotidyltransferase [Pseudomonadota bacterium]
EKILSSIGVSLKKHDIPYMIIGGQAVLLYGEPRLTRDIDITLKPLPKDLKSFVRQTMVLPALDETTGIRVDFIFSLTPYETEAIKRAKKIKIMDREVNFASPEDLIIHKIFAGRPRDIEDVRTVLLKNPDIDVRYVRKWLKEFDLFSEKKEFLKTFEEVIKEI